MGDNTTYNQEKTRISYDFDGTIGHKPHLQRSAKEMCMDPHNEVHIITRRYGYIHPEAGDEVSDVVILADAIGIKRENIHFLDRNYKVGKIKELGIHIHWDDDPTEIALIRRGYPECRGFLTI